MTTKTASEPVTGVSFGALVWRKFKAHRLAMVGAATMLVLTVFTVVGPFLIPYGYEDMDLERIFAPPFSEGHLLGTDELGHDVLVRLMHGGRISLFVGFFSALAATLVGTSVGLASGYLGGAADRILMRFVDVMLSLPLFPILLVLTMALGTGLWNIVIVLVVFGWMAVARLVRGLALTVRESEFVMAAKVTGVKTLSIMFRHILPNVLPIVIVSATLNVSYSILTESSLSYLGLGIQPPMPSWGNMLQRSVNYILGATGGVTPWWLTFFPGFMIFACVLNINFLGDGLRDALDPKFVGEA